MKKIVIPLIVLIIALLTVVPVSAKYPPEEAFGRSASIVDHPRPFVFTGHFPDPVHRHKHPQIVPATIVEEPAVPDVLSPYPTEPVTLPENFDPLYPFNQKHNPPNRLTIFD